MSETTTVKVSRETHDALTALGRKGETYDTIIRKLIRGWDVIEPRLRLSVAAEVLRDEEEEVE